MNCWYPCNAATREPSPVPPCSIPSQKRDADGFLATRKVGDDLVSFGKYKLITMSEALSAAESAVV